MFHISNLGSFSTPALVAETDANGYLPQLGDAFADFDWSNQSAEDVAYMEMEWADQLNKIDEMTREAMAQLDAWRTANV